ncbi:MAG TPA: TGS domain-containing protein [Candidatus Nanoarchaeia archaeon]|nr:TGS domain-containing protein [Candidatus Nanoarchaeia archaeon]
MLITELAKKILRYNKEANFKYLEKAFKNLEKQKIRIREHNYNASMILAGLGLDTTTITVSLLQDTQFKHEDFPKEKIKILEDLEKIKILEAKIENQSSEDLRKIFLTATKDIRVLFIQISNKLEYLRSSKKLKSTEKKKIASEAMLIYAPLSYRLGIGMLKWELEDLAFKILNPKKFKEIKEKLQEKREIREIRIRKTQKIIEKNLHQHNIQADLYGRAKHIYSIYKKIQDRAYNFAEMTDLIAIRIITESIEDCYKILDLIHKLWPPIEGRFKDYISEPKPNGYQSLHTTVKGLEDSPTEIQIRTKEMHHYNEEGIAAHWAYKGLSTEKAFDKQLTLLKETIDQEKSLTSKVDFFADKIYISTPKGKVVELPQRATALDFAYSIHSDIGDKCTGAIINSKFGNIKTKLENGDIVEIVTSKTQNPSKDWLSFVVTEKARSKIRHYLREKGRPVINAFLRKETSETKEIIENLVKIQGAKDAKIKFSLCCKPLPGDKIIGINLGEKKISIHKINCKNIEEKQKKRIYVEWKDSFKESIGINIEAQDRIGIFAEILNTVSSQNINISAVKGKPVYTDQILCSFLADIKETTKLIDLIDRIKRIKGIHKVYLNKIKS